METDKEFIEKIKTLSFIRVKHKERLPYGEKSRGTYIPAEKGRRDIFVPSWGSMEKEEIDYVVEEARGQEDERIKGKSKSPAKERLEKVVEATRQAPRGERAKTAQNLINGMG